MVYTTSSAAYKIGRTHLFARQKLKMCNQNVLIDTEKHDI